MNQPTDFLKQPFYLTDGGMETTLIFHHGIELNHFAAFELVLDEAGREVLKNYYNGYLNLALKYDTGFILESPTWRSNPDWGFKLGYSGKELREINIGAARFVQSLRLQPQYSTLEILVSGNIGPRGDGYRVESAMSAAEAEEYHGHQVEAFKEAGVDLVSAFTLNYTDEAIGVVKAAKKFSLPAVISFTVETDGNLPGGDTLRQAIEKTDDATGNYASYYMINCAHPTHIKEVLKEEGKWKERIRGLRANASAKSHAELDECETLDTGDHVHLAEGYQHLMTLLPNVKVIGGCCGTDCSHIGAICHHVFETVS